MTNNKRYTYTPITVILLTITVMADTRFPVDDPKNKVLENIHGIMPVAYCLVHIEKGKKFEAKEMEPERTTETTINTADFFSDKRQTLKITATEPEGKEVKPSTVVGKKLKAKDIKDEIFKDDVLKFEQYVKENNQIFKPDYNTITKDKEDLKVSEGYGIIIDCYLVNDKKKAKRQVRYMFCDKSQEYFAILNQRMTNDGTDADGKVKWVDNLVGLPLKYFDKGGDRFFMGPLSIYGDGFMDTAQENECKLRIKSSARISGAIWAMVVALAIRLL